MEIEKDKAKKKKAFTMMMISRRIASAFWISIRGLVLHLMHRRICTTENTRGLHNNA